MSADNTNASDNNKDAAATQRASHSATKTQQSQTPNRYQLFNNSGAMLSVPVVNKATGETDMVFVQHGGRPKLSAGFMVDSVFASRNPALQAVMVTN